jgi:hypothetical protein
VTTFAARLTALEQVRARRAAVAGRSRAAVDLTEGELRAIVLEGKTPAERAELDTLIEGGDERRIVQWFERRSVAECRAADRDRWPPPDAAYWRWASP